MRSPRRVAVIAATVTALALAGLGGVAHAAFPNFSGCTATDLEVSSCLDIQQRSGNLNIKGFNMPLHETMEIRGMLQANGTEIPTFVPPTGTNGFFTRPVSVPGGIFGIEWLPGNEVLAITELAGPASSIRLNILTHEVTMPIKVRLVNLLLGMDCHIGTNSRPVVLNLITGTTSPPAPNRPISGSFGEPEGTTTRVIFRGAKNVENSFSVPGATECGLGLGLINSLVNLRLGLPSAGGNNFAEVTNDVALGLP